MRFTRWVVLACGATRALAQAPPLQDPWQHQVQVVRAATAPVIDGKLDDAVWATAAVVDNLHRTSPIDNDFRAARTDITLKAMHTFRF